jgi:hypothetical protein
LTDIYQVDGRIIVDTYAWNRFNPNRQVSLSNLSQPRPQQSDVQSAADGDDGSEDDCTDYGDEDLDEEIIDEASQPGKARPQALTKDQLLLCSASLKGYSLKNKKWRK